MCSIVVTFNESDPDIIKAMSEKVRHRGPDGYEVMTNSHYSVGACRLAIFGQKDATMIYSDQVTDYVVLLNGEIYNYSELWSEISKHGFYPKTDLEAELIARLYQIHGKDFVKYLKGMFAIVIIENDGILLARDRFGIKPLYYKQSGHKLLVSSEIKGILSHSEVSSSLDIEALEETRVFGYVVGQDKTFFKGINQVKPGEAIEFSGDGQARSTIYNRIPHARYMAECGAVDYDEACFQLRSNVISAVQKMFCHGDMEKGVYLSGGIDSSIIALVAKRILNYPVQTFSFGDSEENPDFIAARKVARALGIKHNEYIVSIPEYLRALPDYVAHYESLMAGEVFHVQGGIAFHLLSKKVSESVKVAFSGEGADELFGGYNWIHTHPLGFSDRIRNNLNKLLPNERMSGIVNRLFPSPEDEKKYRRNVFDFLTRSGLSNYHLQSVDRSAGAFGFEIRPLYLYDDLSQHALEMPIEFKVPDNKSTTKIILRDAFRKDFEEAGLLWVTERKKYGMPSAVSNIDREISKTINKTITDEELCSHPLGHLLASKMNLLLYDLFEHVFFKGWDHSSLNPPHGSLLERIWQEYSV